MGNVVKTNTQETVPSDGPKREPEGRSLQQIHSVCGVSLFFSISRHELRVFKLKKEFLDFCWGTNDCVKYVNNKNIKLLTTLNYHK